MNVYAVANKSFCLPDPRDLLHSILSYGVDGGLQFGYAIQMDLE